MQILSTEHRAIFPLAANRNLKEIPLDKGEVLISDDVARAVFAHEIKMDDVIVCVQRNGDPDDILLTSAPARAPAAVPAPVQAPPPAPVQAPPPAPAPVETVTVVVDPAPEPPARKRGKAAKPDAPAPAPAGADIFGVEAK